MRTEISILASLAVMAFAGAAAAREPVHAMTVQLPDGTLEQIRYSGDVAPTVTWRPAPFVSPFAAFDRLASAMDVQMASMMREAAELSALPMSGPGALVPASLGGSGVCVQTVRIVETEGGPPRVTTGSAGDCGAARAVPSDAPAVRHLPGTFLVRDSSARPPLRELASR